MKVKINFIDIVVFMLRFCFLVFVHAPLANLFIGLIGWGDVSLEAPYYCYSAIIAVVYLGKHWWLFPLLYMDASFNPLQAFDQMFYEIEYYPSCFYGFILSGVGTRICVCLLKCLWRKTVYILNNFLQLINRHYGKDKRVSIVVICVLMMNSIVFASSEEYRPSPLLLVHGFGSGSNKSWGKFLSEIDKRELFKKYKNGGSLCYAVNYSWGLSNASPIDVGKRVTDDIQGLIKMNAGQNKVRVIAHSMGGLATRYAYDPNHIEKVVFLGVPHLGSPLASVLWVYNKLVNHNFHDILQDYCTYSFSSSKEEEVSNLFCAASQYIDKWCGDLERIIGEIYNKTKIRADGDAIFAMRVANGDCLFNKKQDFKSKSSGAKLSVNIAEGHVQNEFLLDNSIFKIPLNMESLSGTAGCLMGSFLSRLQAAMYGGVFTLPHGNDFASLDSGDFVVSRLSQSALGESADVFRHHTTETKDVDTILKLLDDAPKVKRVRIVEAPPYARGAYYNCYLIFKVEEYFLADLEVEGSVTNGILDSQWRGKVKPFEILDREFLRTRPFINNYGPVLDYYLNPVTLEPGEFAVKVNNLNNLTHEAKFIFSNPGGNEKELIFKFSRPSVSEFEFSRIDSKEDSYYQGARVCTKKSNHRVCISYYDEIRIDTSCHPEDRYVDVSCLISDSLFNGLIYSAEMHQRLQNGGLRTARIDHVVNKSVASSGSNIKLKIQGENFVNDKYGIFDVFLGVIGMDNGAPANEINGDDIASNFKLSIMGTSYDHKQEYFSIQSYWCDPAFLQAPRIKIENPQKDKAVKDQNDTAFVYYLNRLGITQNEICVSEDKKVKINNGILEQPDFQAMPLHKNCIPLIKESA